MAGFNISLSLNERQTSSDKKHNKSLRLVLFIPFRCCFAGSLPFSLSTVKQTKLFHSISEMFFIFLRRKTLWEKLFSSNVCKAGLSKLEEKAGILARNSHTYLASDWTYHFSLMWKNVVRNSDWMYHYFFFTCENHSSLLWLAKNSFAYQNLQHNFLVNVCQYV